MRASIRKHTQPGFTIVELLVVIVTIAILASITVVAYNGVQQRARYSAIKHDLGGLDTVIQIYYADNGRYPSIAGGATVGCTTASSVQTLSIDGLIPTYTYKIPVIPNDGVAGYYAYCIATAQSEYKLIRLVPGGTALPQPEQSDPHPDPTRPGRGWGFWSTGGSAL